MDLGGLFSRLSLTPLQGGIDHTDLAPLWRGLFASSLT
jgi:hypothetical protein